MTAALAITFLNTAAALTLLAGIASVAQLALKGGSPW